MAASLLQTIAQRKYLEVAQAKKNNPMTSLQRDPALGHRDFIAALQSCPSPAVIAEIKKASPSKGLLREPFDVAEIARSYAAFGACCLSVLTDKDFFQGHPDYLAVARAHCTLPVLRKDFIVDAYQIYESWAMGADCVLLIVSLLDDRQLADFCALAQELRLGVLVESHSAEELQRALPLPTPLMGINNRSLHDFTVDIQRSVDLAPCIPRGKIPITESGILQHADVAYLQGHGIHTFLVGESLMRAKDVGLALDILRYGERMA